MVVFSNQVYRVVRQIPRGKVATYAQVAAAAGRPLAARAVGNALHQNPHLDVPCHRVVNARGRLAPNFGKGGFRQQRKLLIKEGVKFKNEKTVDLEFSRVILEKR